MRPAPLLHPSSPWHMPCRPLHLPSRPNAAPVALPPRRAHRYGWRRRARRSARVARGARGARGARAARAAARLPPMQRRARHGVPRCWHTRQGCTAGLTEPTECRWAVRRSVRGGGGCCPWLLRSEVTRCCWSTLRSMARARCVHSVRCSTRRPRGATAVLRWPPLCVRRSAAGAAGRGLRGPRKS